MLCGHTGVVTGNAVVVGIADSHDADAALLCLVDGHFHSLHTEYLAHGIVAFNGGGQGSFLDNLRFGLQLYIAFRYLMVIADQTLNAMGFNAAEVCVQQNIGDLGTFFFCKAVTLKYFDTEKTGFFIRNMMILHNLSP